jgi:hypothetical protein
MTRKKQEQETEQLAQKWGAKSWALRIGEDVEHYGLFSQYLHSNKTTVADWLTEEAQIPHFRHKEILSIAADFSWDMRKNDYVNQIYAFARENDEKKLKKAGDMMSELVDTMTAVALTSAQEMLKNGQLASFGEVNAFLKNIVSAKILFEDLEVRRKTVQIDKNMPAEKIRKLLELAKGDDE